VKKGIVYQTYVYWTVHHCDSWIRDQLDVTRYYVLFHFFYAQHVSDINTSIIGCLLHGYHPNPATPKLQHTSKQGRCDLKLTTPEYISKVSPINQWNTLHTWEHVIYKQKIPGQHQQKQAYQPLFTIIYTNAKNLHLYRTHDQCGDTTEKSQAPDDGCINVRNMLSIEEVK